jgi:hypothetical protein
MSDRLRELREAGWMVAVHNDYRQNGEARTFWLFTRNGQAIKGEGSTDDEALNQVAAALAEKPAERPADSEQERLAQMGDEQQYLFHVEGRAERPQLSAEQVRALCEDSGECTWCGWPYHKTTADLPLHGYDCKGATLANLPEGPTVDNSYEKLRTRVGYVAEALLTGEAEKVPPATQGCLTANPNCPLCQGLGSWVKGEICTCMSPAAPPVIQAEPDVERAKAYYRSRHPQWFMFKDDKDVATLAAEFAAIRREAERAAFEKAAQAMCSRCLKSDPQRQPKDAYISNFGEVKAGDWTHPWERDGKDERELAWCKAGPIHEMLRALANSPVSGAAAKEKRDE